MTLIYLDVETTGLDPKRNSIIQLSGIIKSNGEEESFNYRIKPYKNDRMSAEATEKTGVTTEEAYSYPHQSIAFEDFTKKIYKYVTSYSTKAYLIGYNVGFDDSFMRAWFEYNHTPWGYQVWFPYIDVMTLAGLYTIGKRPLMKNFQLTTVYEAIIGHPFENAHDAMADILATKELFEKLTVDLMIKPKPFLNFEADLTSDSESIPF